MLASLQACQPKTSVERVYADFPPWPGDVVDASCKSGQRLKLTGVCTDDNPATFVSITPDEIEGNDWRKHCTWRAADARLPDGAGLVFRTLTCRLPAMRIGNDTVPLHGAEDRYSYSFHYNRYRGLARSSREEPPRFYYGIEVFPRSPNEAAEQTALNVLKARLVERRERIDDLSCTAFARTDVPRLVGLAFSLRSTNKMTVRDPCDAGWKAYWEDRGSHLLLHPRTPDDGFIDPVSYTIYARDREGRWRKSA
jgi:hypothetical protein